MPPTGRFVGPVRTGFLLLFSPEKEGKRKDKEERGIIQDLSVKALQHFSKRGEFYFALCHLSLSGEELGQ
jgi:hypothetical protein